MRSLSLKETANGTEKREFRLKQRNHGSDTVPHEGVCQGESKTFFVEMERRPLLFRPCPHDPSATNHVPVSRVSHTPFLRMGVLTLLSEGCRIDRIPSLVSTYS